MTLVTAAGGVVRAIRSPNRLLFALTLVALLWMSPATAATSGAAVRCGESTPPPARYDHVVWIVMENHMRASVIGSRDAPFETYVAASCGSADDYRMVGSPSLPNYIGMTTGGTQDVRDDASPARHVLTVDNIFRQVRATGRKAITYAEAMPSPCTLVGSGRYAVKHNPAAYFQGGDDRVACRRDNVPAGTLASGAFVSALRTKTLPSFAIVIPDLCNDTHDCSVATGDQWLSEWVPAITRSSSYAEGRTAVFIAWDEMTPMPFIAIAPTVVHGVVTHTALDHYALLRTTEELLGIPTHLGRAATAPSMRSLFRI